MICNYLRARRTALLGFLAVVFMTFTTLVFVSTAYADPSRSRASSSDIKSQLDQANARLEEISRALAATHQGLLDTQGKLDETQASLDDLNNKIKQAEDDIAKKQAELKDAQTRLSKRISSSYKAGGFSLLDAILKSTTFDEVVSKVYYADKVNAADSQAIAAVKTIKADLQGKRDALEAEKGEKEKLISQQKALIKQQSDQKADLSSRENKQKEYISSLSAELQGKLREEEEARAAAAARARAAARYTGGGSIPVATKVRAEGSLSDDERKQIVAAAYTQLGVPYQLGGSTPGVALDCSGLSMFCYAKAGYRIGRTAQAQCVMTSSRGNLGPLSSARPGDLVFYTSGSYVSHVAIYIGNGKVIHEPRPGGYCEVADAAMMTVVGAGSPV